MSSPFLTHLRVPSRTLYSLLRPHTPHPLLWSRCHYQMQSENARQMLIRKDDREMSTHEIQTLFKNMGTLLDDVSKDPKNYKPLDLDGTESLMLDLRQVRLEYAPAQLRFLSANFMTWYHGYKAKTVYANLHHISTQYDVASHTKENQFNAFSDEVLAWSKHLGDDMEIVWALLDNIDIETLQREGEIEDEEEMMKIVRNLRMNASLYLNHYNKYLLNSYNDIMEFSKNVTFLEFDEAQLALTASPFLGKFDVMSALIDRLTQEKARECKKNPEILVDKVLDLPTGLNWFNLYQMYENGSKYKSMIEQWENEQDLFYDAHDRASTVRNVNDLCWFTMDKFESKIVDIYIGNEGKEDVDTDWSSIKEKYLDEEYNKQCDLITKHNSLLRKMGNSCQIICLLGSEQSIFGESVLHLTGFWLNNFTNINGDGDKIVVAGKNVLQMGDYKDDKQNQAFLVHEESWDLLQQYSVDKDNIFVAGMCDTEQRIQSHHGEKLQIPNIPTVIRLRTQIQMTLTKQC